MAPATTSASINKVLLARVGTAEPYRRFADALAADGIRVVEHPSSLIGAHSSPEAVQGLLEGVDLAVLVVRKEDERQGGGPVKPLHAVLREAGVLQGRLGFDRVVLMVEDSVEGLGSDPGVPVVRFPDGRPDRAADRVVARLGEPGLGDVTTVTTVSSGGTSVAAAGTDAEITTLLSPDEADELQRWQASAVDTEVPDTSDIPDLPDTGAASRLTWLERENTYGIPAVIVLLLLVALMALVALLFASLRFGGGDDAGPDENSVVADGGATDAPDGVDPAGPQAPLVDSTMAGGATGGTSEATSCSLNLVNDLEETIACEGGGSVELEGWAGPWSDSLQSLVASEGVEGFVVYEGDGQQIPFLPDVTPIEREVDQLLVNFTVDGQRVHLFDEGDGGQARTTLTFRPSTE